MTHLWNNNNTTEGKRKKELLRVQCYVTLCNAMPCHAAATFLQLQCTTCIISVVYEYLCDLP